jgi:hypothetical protein
VSAAGPNSWPERFSGVPGEWVSSGYAAAGNSNLPRRPGGPCLITLGISLWGPRDSGSSRSSVTVLANSTSSAKPSRLSIRRTSRAAEAATASFSGRSATGCPGGSRWCVWSRCACRSWTSTTPPHGLSPRLSAHTRRGRCPNAHPLPDLRAGTQGQGVDLHTRNVEVVSPDRQAWLASRRARGTRPKRCPGCRPRTRGWLAESVRWPVPGGALS